MIIWLYVAAICYLVISYIVVYALIRHIKCPVALGAFVTFTAPLSIFGVVVALTGKGELEV